MDGTKLLNQDVYVKLHGVAKPVSARLKHLNESLIGIEGDGLSTELVLATGQPGIPPAFKTCEVYLPLVRVEWLMIARPS